MSERPDESEARLLRTEADRLTVGYAFWSRLVAVARPIVGEAEAEDVASEAILRGATAPVDSPERLRDWLLTTTRRAAYDVVRHRPSQRVVTRVAVPERAPDHADAICHEAELRWLAGYVARLPKPQRIVAECVMAGEGAREVAAVLGCTRKAAQRRIDRTRALLRVAVLAARVAAWVGMCWRFCRRALPVTGPAVAAVTLLVLLPVLRTPNGQPQLGVIQASAPEQPGVSTRRASRGAATDTRGASESATRSVQRRPTVTPTRTGFPKKPTGHAFQPTPDDGNGAVEDVLSCVRDLRLPPDGIGCPLTTGSPSR